VNLRSFLTKICGGAEAVGACHHMSKNALASRHVERGAAFAARCVAHGLWESVAWEGFIAQLRKVELSVAGKAFGNPHLHKRLVKHGRESNDMGKDCRSAIPAAG
jgi:hypothetical protein